MRFPPHYQKNILCLGIGHGGPGLGIELNFNTEINTYLAVISTGKGIFVVL
jgi:hypothetical protein